MKKGGELVINVLKISGGLSIEIIDNGVGMQKATSENSGGNGIGLKTIKQIIELNNQNRKHKISQKVIDLKNVNGQSAGIKVVLKILD